VNDWTDIDAAKSATHEELVARIEHLEQVLGRLVYAADQVLDVYDQLSPTDRPVKPIILNRSDMERLRAAVRLDDTPWNNEASKRMAEERELLQAVADAAEVVLPVITTESWRWPQLTATLARLREHRKGTT